MHSMMVDDQTLDTPLYKWIGGHDVIAAIIDDLFALTRANARFAAVSRGSSSALFRRSQCNLCSLFLRAFHTAYAGTGNILILITMFHQERGQMFTAPGTKKCVEREACGDLASSCASMTRVCPRSLCALKMPEH